jgi:hypothetical protein
LMGLILSKPETLNKQVAKSIDLRDLLSGDQHLLEGETGTLADDFKIFSSKDDYNREFLCVFQTFKSSFYLDHNHKDGHFRV